MQQNLTVKSLIIKDILNLFEIFSLKWEGGGVGLERYFPIYFPLFLLVKSLAYNFFISFTSINLKNSFFCARA